MAYLAPSGLKFISGNLNSTAVNTMQSTAQVLIPAPGAGLINIVQGCFFNVKVGSIPWSGGDIANVWLVYGTTGNDQVNLASTFLTNQINSMSANTNYIFGGALGAIGSDWLGGNVGNIVKVLSSNAINKPVSITCVNAVTSGANGNIDYKLWYYVVPAA